MKIVVSSFPKDNSECIFCKDDSCTLNGQECTSVQECEELIEIFGLEDDGDE